MTRAANSLAANAILSNQADVGTFTRLPLLLPASAPAGTATFRLVIQIFGVASGAPFAYVDDVVLNLA